MKGGYLPKDDSDNPVEKFQTQFLRLLEEIGEASHELRRGNQSNFEMELGDVLVLEANCTYIVNLSFNNDAAMKLIDAKPLIRNVIRVASDVFGCNYEAKRKDCLTLAYNKIKNRGGVLINGDYFKPGDAEYEKYMKIHKI